METVHDQECKHLRNNISNSIKRIAIEVGDYKESGLHRSWSWHIEVQNTKPTEYIAMFGKNLGMKILLKYK